MSIVLHLVHNVYVPHFIGKHLNAEFGIKHQLGHHQLPPSSGGSRRIIHEPLKYKLDKLGTDVLGGILDDLLSDPNGEFFSIIIMCCLLKAPLESLNNKCAIDTDPILDELFEDLGLCDARAPANLAKQRQGVEVVE